MYNRREFIQIEVCFRFGRAPVLGEPAASHRRAIQTVYIGNIDVLKSIFLREPQGNHLERKESPYMA